MSVFFGGGFRHRRLRTAAALKRGGILEKKLKQLVYATISRLPHVYV